MSVVVSCNKCGGLVGFINGGYVPRCVACKLPWTAEPKDPSTELLVITEEAKGIPGDIFTAETLGLTRIVHLAAPTVASPKTLEVLKALLANGERYDNEGNCAWCFEEAECFGGTHEPDCPYLAAVAHLKDLE